MVYIFRKIVRKIFELTLSRRSWSEAARRGASSLSRPRVIRLTRGKK